MVGGGEPLSHEVGWLIVYQHRNPTPHARPRDPSMRYQLAELARMGRLWEGSVWAAHTDRTRGVQGAQPDSRAHVGAGTGGMMGRRGDGPPGPGWAGGWARTPG
eukprot:scaffold1148_cov108-Isochrysis_galbana.AAC.13